MIHNQKDIAPTLAKILELSYPVPSGKSLDISENLIGRNVLLAIIDSMDWEIYKRFGKPVIENGPYGFIREFKVSAAAKETSPSIATILTGLNPDEHKVFSTKDARNSETINLVEFAEKNDVKATVVMEKKGADTFLNTLEKVSGVKDTEDVDVFDRNILSEVRTSLEDFEFIVCHLRTVDEYLHQGRDLEEIGGGLEKILRNVIDLGKKGDFLTVITGDHKSHGEVLDGSETLPLVFLDSKNC